LHPSYHSISASFDKVELDLLSDDDDDDAGDETDFEMVVEGTGDVDDTDTDADRRVEKAKKALIQSTKTKGSKMQVRICKNLSKQVVSLLEVDVKNSKGGERKQTFFF
jgi:hypothetical protein